MDTQTTYYAWRRSDGYVDATAYDPTRMTYPNHAFQVLAASTDWSAVVAVVKAERG